MRVIAFLNQKGGVGKTTTVVNLGAALAEKGRRVIVVDLDPQANLSVHLGLEVEDGAPSTYRMLLGEIPFAEAVRGTSTPGLAAVATDLDLSGAELELANQFGRETLLREALTQWREEHRGQRGAEPADYVLLDCPPSLGLLSINALAAADEIFICVQTEFFAMRGLSKLVEIVELVQKRLHPELKIGGIVPCLYDNRLKLAREVLGEVKGYFPGLVFPRGIGINVKLAEAPSHGATILEYAPESAGARDYRLLADEVLAQEPAASAPADGARPEAPDARSEEAPAVADVVLVPKEPARDVEPAAEAES